MAYPADVTELTDGVPADGIAAATVLGSGTYPHDDHHRALAVTLEAVQSELVGAFTSYTPTLTATTTSPTLGTGSSATGYYRQIGRMVFGYLEIAFGSSGASAGSGYYGMLLPVEPVNRTQPVGVGFAVDSSDNARAIAATAAFAPSLWATSTRKAVIVITNPAGSGFLTSANPVGAAAPWTWAEGDSIAINFHYEALASA